MANLTSALAASQWRLLAKTDAAAPLTANSYTVTRQDGGPGAPTVANAFLPNPSDLTTVALIMSVPLMQGVIYVAALGTGSATVAFQPPTGTPETISPTDDPEAEAFFIDWDWIDGDPSANGDIPRRRGLDCLMHDLPMRGRLAKNELVQTPDAGAGLDDDVNATADPGDMAAAAGRYEAECRQDRRVEQATVTPVYDNAGGLQFQTLIKPYALDILIDLENENG